MEVQDRGQVGGPSKRQARPRRVSAAPQGAHFSSKRCPPGLFSWHGQRAVSPATSSPASLLPVSTLSHRQNGCLIPSRALEAGGASLFTIQETTSTEHEPTPQTGGWQPQQVWGRTAAPKTAGGAVLGQQRRPHTARLPLPEPGEPAPAAPARTPGHGL